MKIGMETEVAAITIREAVAVDAERLLAYMRRLLSEPEIDFIISVGEFTVSVEQERQLIERYAMMENSVFLLAEQAGSIVGVLHCQGGGLAATRHTTRMAISVRPDMRDRGIGSKLMAACVAWARSVDIMRLELEVFARNARAVHLYEKFGFQHEGNRRKAVHRYGQYHDLLMMAIILGE